MNWFGFFLLGLDLFGFVGFFFVVVLADNFFLCAFAPGSVTGTFNFHL